MGILNVTPDSFFSDSRPSTLDRIIERALLMEAEGAGCIDIGGESTRPGAALVSVQEELERVIPVLEALKPLLKIPVSLDSRRYEVMKAGVHAGIQLFNSQDALECPKARAFVASTNLPVILMHQSSEPALMAYAQPKDIHDNVIDDVVNAFEQLTHRALSAGVAASNIILDPGFAFGKTPTNSLRLVKAVPRFKALGYPVLMGVSRKSPIGALLNGVPASERAAASLVLDMVGALYGVSMIRTHDVKQAVHGLTVLSALKEL